MFTGYVCCIVIADHPTVVECIRFRGRKRRINIVKEIGTKYIEFGILLLEDTTGGRLHNMKQQYREDAEKINLEILYEWINGKGKQPVTWGTLTEVLCDIGLSALASEIEDVKLVLDVVEETLEETLEGIQIPWQTHPEGMCT